MLPHNYCKPDYSIIVTHIHMQHTLPSVQVPPYSPDSAHPLPAVVFRLFSSSDVRFASENSTLPASIDRYLATERVTAILASHHTNRKEWWVTTPPTTPLPRPLQCCCSSSILWELSRERSSSGWLHHSWDCVWSHDVSATPPSSARLLHCSTDWDV